VGCAPIRTWQRHQEVPDRIDRNLQADSFSRGAHDVVRRLFARSVTAAHDTAPAPGSPIELLEQGGAIELLLPGGSLVALVLWLYRRYKKATPRAA
jgi:hypothetical protein